MQLSPQQQAVVAWVRSGQGSRVVEAVAGSGKTTLLVSAIVETTGTVAFMAFNKSAAGEIQARIADRADPASKNYDERYVGLNNRVKVGTFHSFGFSAVRKVYPNTKVDAREKANRVVQAFAAVADIQFPGIPGVLPELPASLEGAVAKLVSLAKQRAIGLFGAVEDKSLWFDIIDHFDLMNDVEGGYTADQLVDFAIRALKYHNELAPELIDFDDMIYLPVVKGMRLWENDWIFVDEAQDTNPARRALARKLLRKDGRAAFVGDRHQAIYGFTGADADAFDQIKRDFGAEVMPLSVSFRCPKLVVAEARRVVSHIEAAETAAEGSVLDCNDDQWAAMMKGKETYAPAPGQIGDRIMTALAPADAILCRLTKPLVQTAYQLIRNGIPCHVEGKDIGVGLLKLANKFSARDIEQLRDKLESYMETECQKLIAKGKETMAEALADRIETLFVIMEGCPDVECVKDKIVRMFVDGENERKPTLTLSTIHKAKGREWNRVFLMGRFELMPSKWARQEWQLEQEKNLIYVGVTRAKSELVYVPAPQPPAS